MYVTAKWARPSFRLSDLAHLTALRTCMENKEIRRKIK